MYNTFVLCSRGATDAKTLMRDQHSAFNAGIYFFAALFFPPPNIPKNPTPCSVAFDPYWGLHLTVKPAV